MTDTYQTLLLSTSDSGIAQITINRPNKLNALNKTVLDELSDAVASVANDDQITGLIITGAGEKAFVAGADIKELSELDKESGEKLSKRGQEIFSQIENLSKPVVAIVNGYAMGGGAELAMACHLRIATKNAVFGLPEVSLGVIPGYGGTQRLTKLIGKARAFEFILTGGQIKADQAQELGLVNKIAESDGQDEAEKLLAAITKNGPIAVSKAITAINAADGNKGYETEASLFGELCETEDFKEGTGAFLEKRKANFKGK